MSRLMFEHHVLFIDLKMLPFMWNVDKNIMRASFGKQLKLM